MPLPLILIPVVKGALWIGAGVAGAVGIGKFTKQSEENYFNNGVCKKCGGHFKPIERKEPHVEKGYKCDFCDNCVWITFGTDEGYKYTPSHISKTK